MGNPESIISRLEKNSKMVTDPISYDYNYPHNKVKYGKEKQHLYLNKVIWGLGAILAYINPGSLPFMLYKEVYRLEVNLRRLEDEKKTDYYNEVV